MSRRDHALRGIALLRVGQRIEGVKLIGRRTSCTVLHSGNQKQSCDRSSPFDSTTGFRKVPVVIHDVVGGEDWIAHPVIDDGYPRQVNGGVQRPRIRIAPTGLRQRPAHTAPDIISRVAADATSDCQLCRTNRRRSPANTKEIVRQHHQPLRLQGTEAWPTTSTIVHGPKAADPNPAVIVCPGGFRSEKNLCAKLLSMTVTHGVFVVSSSVRKRPSNSGIPVARR